MKLTYVYHSGFVLEGEKSTLILDYYKDSRGKREGVIHELLASRNDNFYIFVSHSHPDHYNPEIWQWAEGRPHLHYLISEEIVPPAEVGRDRIVFLKKGDTWQDKYLKVKAYGSTDSGISFLVETEGKRIFHAGDLNNWHWKEESTPEEAEKAEAEYLNELTILAGEVDRVDVAMFPVDPRLGKEYDRGARQFLERIPTGLFVPMHFWEKYEKANAFRKCAGQRGSKFVAWEHPGEKINLE